jgi:hypothetical protein
MSTSTLSERRMAEEPRTADELLDRIIERRSAHRLLIEDASEPLSIFDVMLRIFMPSPLQHRRRVLRSARRRKQQQQARC